MKRDIGAIRDKLRADKRSSRLRTLFTELPLYQLPIDAHIKEIEQIHKTRGIRVLTQSSPRFIEAVVDASLLDQANRSRLVEISMGCYKAENTLTEALDLLRTHLLMTYAVDLAFVRTKDERNQIVNMALAPFMKFVSRAAQCRELANMVIKDIDQGAYSLQRLIAAFNLKAGRGEQTL